jgi:hypothetical protein
MVRASAYCRSWLMEFEIDSKIEHPQTKAAWAECRTPIWHRRPSPAPNAALEGD